MREAISLKFGMWSTEVGGSVHSKNRIVSSRQHRATEVRKLHFLSSCQYTHGCCAPASWAARHTTVCLDVRHTTVCLDVNILTGVARRILGTHDTLPCVLITSAGQKLYTCHRGTSLLCLRFVETVFLNETMLSGTRKRVV